MNSIELLSKIYKPYKVTIKNSCRILNCTSGNYVIKEKKEKNIKDLYQYLSSRSFLYFPKLISDNRENINVFEYVEDLSLDDEQKLYDLINVVSLLHSKTSYYKEITNDKLKTIYENLMGRVSFMEEYFNNLIFEMEDNVFVSPSHNLLLVNSTKIFESIVFLKKEIDEWYKLSVDKNKMRVSLVHNNLSLEHYIKNKDDYLISWDNYVIDTPILDIVKLYKRTYLKMDFSEPLKLYMEKFPLNEEEKKLLFIMLVLPEEINFSESELKNVYTVRKYLDYVFKTENLIRPYYSV